MRINHIFLLSIVFMCLLSIPILGQEYINAQQWGSDAESIEIADSGGYYTSDNVEGALQEIGAGGGGSSEWSDSGSVLSTADLGRSVSISNELSVEGNVYLGQSLTIDNDLTVHGQVSATAVSSTFDTVIQTSQQDNDYNISGSWRVNDDVFFSFGSSNNIRMKYDSAAGVGRIQGDSLIIGDGGTINTSYINGDGDLQVENDCAIGGDLSIMGDTLIYGNLTLGGNLVGLDESSGVMTINGDLSTSGDATINGTLYSGINTLSVSGNVTLTTNQVRSNVVVYIDGPGTVTMPAVSTLGDVKGSATIITIGAVAVSLDVNASDKQILDGTPLDDGDKATNTSTAGDMAVITYFSADGWVDQTNGWTDGGA